MADPTEPYGYSDLGIPVGVDHIADDVTDRGRGDLRGFAMGALAAQDRYAPFQPSIATGTTPWKAQEIAGARVDEPRDPTLLDPATNQFLGEQAKDLVVPSTPWEAGLMLSGPAGRVAGKVGKAAAATAGFLASDIQDAEAASLRKLLSATGVQDLKHAESGFSPWTHNRLADRRFAKPMHEIPVEYSGKFPGTNIVKPEWLEGAVMTPLVGDPTMSGRIVHAIDDVPLSTPLHTRGGHGYIRETEGYANDKGMATTIANRVKGLQETFNTDRVIGTHTKMGPQSGDFSHHTWGALARLLPEAKMTGAAKDDLDAAIKKAIAATPVAKGRENWPEFPGVRDKKLEAHLASMPDAYRKAVIDATAKAHGAIPGVPSVGAIRYATTDPELLFAPAGSSGLSMTQLTGDIRPGSHPDFPRHLEGKGNFGLGGVLRQEVMFPDIVKRFDETNYNAPDQWLRKMYMPPKGVPHAQLATPQWVDNTSRYIEDVPKMGELAAFDKYRQDVLKWRD